MRAYLVGIMVASGACGIVPAHGADATSSDLIGCWRQYDDEHIDANVRRVPFPDGEIGLVWGTDPNTGEEIRGLLPYSQLCFGADGRVESLRMLIDEGLGTSGSYQLDGRVLSVHEDRNFLDGWVFGGSGNARCSVVVDQSTLVIANCVGPDGLSEMRFDRIKLDD